jgi:hypothetical protein
MSYKRELQAERTFVLFFGLFDRMQAIPKSEDSPDHDSDENADQKEDTICRQGNEKDSDDRDRDEQRSGTVQAEAEAARRHTANILALAWSAGRPCGRTSY